MNAHLAGAGALLEDLLHQMNAQDADQPNVYQMFVAFGGPGFWVRRTAWASSCARVVRVGALAGAPPYYGSPSVIMDVYTLDGTLRDAAAQLPVPGTYKTWRQIAPPTWAEPRMLRPLDDPTLDEALAKLDRRRGKSGAKTAAARHTLTVPYERKGEAKAIGAKWDPTAHTWWIQADDTDAATKALQLGFLRCTPER